MSENKPTLLDRLANFLGMARTQAYRMWKWQVDEAILVSSRTPRAWEIRVELHPVCGTDDPPQEHIVVIEIDRETGAPILDEPERYVPTGTTSIFEHRIDPDDPGYAA